MGDWMMVLLDFGCMVFIAKTALEHVYLTRELQPQIQDLVDRADAFEAKTAEEIDLRSAARSRLGELKTLTKTAERELEDLRRELATSLKMFERLELAAHEDQFRKGVRNGRRAHHPAAAAD